LQDTGITTFYDGNSVYVWESRSAVASSSLPGAAGSYSSTDVNVAKGPYHNDVKAYGPNDVLRTNDSRGRWGHGGGGTTIAAASVGRQGWMVTLGCTRYQNDDIMQLTSLVSAFKAQNPGVAIPYARYSTGLDSSRIRAIAYSRSTISKAGFE
jgi:hypothetical protein